MTSIAEEFKAEVLARLQALPLPVFFPELDSIRRSHLTNVPREKSPAIHLRFPRARPVKDKSCNWQWTLDVTVSVYSRDDSGDVMADPLVGEVVTRLNPETSTGYGNGVVVELESIENETEIADEDATRVDIKFTGKFATRAWQLDAAP